MKHVREMKLIKFKEGTYRWKLKKRGREGSGWKMNKNCIWLLHQLHSTWNVPFFWKKSRCKQKREKEMRTKGGSCSVRAYKFKCKTKHVRQPPLALSPIFGIPSRWQLTEVGGKREREGEDNRSWFTLGQSLMQTVVHLVCKVLYKVTYKVT